MHRTAACAGGGVRGDAARRARHLADDELLVLQNHDPLDHVLQLADVARPLIGLKEVLKLVGQLALRPVVAPRIAVDEELCELRNLGAPLAQRRHRHLDHLQAIVKIFAELTVLEHDFEVAVRRRDDAHVDVDRFVAAELRELRVL